MSIDLNQMDLKELKKLRGDLHKAIETYESRRKMEALAQLEAVARDHGFALQDILSGKTVGKTKVTPTPRYAHPQNASLTWSGRGRKPQWFADALEAGTAPEDMLI